MPQRLSYSRSELKPRISSRNLRLTVVLLLVLAAPPRLVDLGKLGFYADEETSAFPARALADGQGPRMPSGMPYYRALPLTWLESATARLLGVEREVAYRIPVAILGVLTVPLLFLLGRLLVGGPAALIASILLAFSEWHLVFSRQARMYVPLLFVFLAAAYAMWLWARTGKRRHMLAAVLLGILSVTVHAAGALVFLFLLLPLALLRRLRASAAALLTAAGLIVASGYAYSRYFVGAPYRLWDASGHLSANLRAPESPVLSGHGFDGEHLVTAALALVGIGLGFWSAAHSLSTLGARISRFRQAAVLSAAAAAGGLLFSGHLHGSALAGLVFLLLQPGQGIKLTRRLWVSIGIGAVVGLTWFTITSIDHGTAAALQRLISFPFPYLGLVARQFPLIVILFLAATVWLALVRSDGKQSGARACAIAAILIIAAVGAARPWGGTRFVFPAYPFLLLVTARGLVAALAPLKRWRFFAGEGRRTTLAIAIAVSGILTGHGIPQAWSMVTLDYGEPVNEWMHMYAFRPDHKGPGEFVRRMRLPGDLVIAEDPLQQRWYAGAADYWFRSLADARVFLYRAEDGHLRDIYVGSAIIGDRAHLNSIIDQAQGKIWLITSGETYSARSYYLDPWQQHWLDSLELAREPSFKGRDQATNAYCLNCQDGRQE